MRILTFLHSFEPGGVERVALRLVRQWREEGVDAPLFMGRSAGAMRTELANDLAYYEPPQPGFSTGWCETLWMIVTLPGFVRRTAPDLLFCAGNSYAVVAVALKLVMGRRCPPIVAKVSNDLDRRDMMPPVRLLYRGWLWIQGRLIDRFIGMEQPMAEEIGAAMRITSDRIAIVPDPALSRSQIDQLRMMDRPRSGGDTGVRFIAVGRLVAQKNFALMLRAFAAGAGAADTLVIYGDGPERAKLARLIDRLGLAGRAKLGGHVADPASMLGHFDIFLLSSDYEGVPAVLLEAMAAGLPIITTRSSRSIAALLMDGLLGTIVPTGDVVALGQAICNAATLQQDATASLAQAKRFTIEEAAGDYLFVFAALLHKRHRSENISLTD
ncbi:glycosyltransferase [Sphingobium sp. HWE2-09]|uniref:glycosyltransferase n=1 Tax=Sphingobium sp. HWE2-09 TaxID=3108390 RepID=UPI002DD1B3CF|nr:glycosyltransferase [Sphingobium sp. HWE2-09]